LVLERRPASAASPQKRFPGFKYSTCAHLAGTFSQDIIAELELKKHGLEVLPLDPLLFAPLLEGQSFLFPRQHSEIAEAIGRHSRADATKFEPFTVLVKKLTGFLRSLNNLPLPDGKNSGGLNLPDIVKLGWKFHRLGEREMYEFLRILPMSVADLLNEWFETDVLKASLAASGILGSFVGPRAQEPHLCFSHQLENERRVPDVDSCVAVGTAGIHMPSDLARKWTGVEVTRYCQERSQRGSCWKWRGDFRNGNYIKPRH
jgi:phytoene dehydrogenase-like protein